MDGTRSDPEQNIAYFHLFEESRHKMITMIVITMRYECKYLGAEINRNGEQGKERVLGVKTIEVHYI
jgi:hypothetical protein